MGRLLLLTLSFNSFYKNTGGLHLSTSDDLTNKKLPMGDLNIPPLHPPGFRFFPTEQQLICFYLTNKNNRNPNFSSSVPNPPFLSFDVIQEIDLYNSDPCDLPAIASFPFGLGGSKKHWYCFTVRVRKGGLKRKAKGGFWKRKGPIRNVLCGEKGVVMGTKTTFVFYRRESSTRGSCKTNWAMIEYALVDHQKDSFVLCRVFLKPCNGTRTVEPVRNFYDEENIAAKQNISIELPSMKNAASDIAQLVHEDILVGNGVEMFPIKPTAELDDKVATGQISDDGFGPFLDFHNFIDPVNSSGWFTRGRVSMEEFMSDELRVNSTILEGNFLELNDLVAPLGYPYS